MAQKDYWMNAMVLSAAVTLKTPVGDRVLKAILRLNVLS